MDIGFVSASSHRRAKRPLPPAQRVVRLVARAQNIQKSLLFNNSRCPAGVARARQLAMYLTHVVLQESFTAIGLAFGRDRTTVSHACALIEDMRDDPHFDAEVSRLEGQLEEMSDE